MFISEPAVIAGLFVSIAFAYYRQCLDPTSPANASRAPPAQQRMPNDQFPEHYNPPYMAYDAPQQSYAPPPGPPPQLNKPPMYTDGSARYDDGKDDATLHGDDPFADFDGPSHGKLGESKDTLV